jgi:riboflavin kinase / FMN adenylyltransferase
MALHPPPAHAPQDGATPQRGDALTIGTFDGVHAGHRELLKACKVFVASRGKGRVLALAFDPHPMTTLRPAFVPPRLTTFERKRELLLAAGADEVVRLSPTHQMLAQTAEEFATNVLDRYQPALIVEGGDFHFGKDRTGSVRTLRAFAESRGCHVEDVPAVEVELTDLSRVRASSTLARSLIGAGRVLDAASVLGRPYELSGVVVRGDRLGRTIGVPTCNLHVSSERLLSEQLASEQTHDICLIPANGVYAGVAILPDGQRCTAAINIGDRPTVGGLTLRIEAVLLDDRALPAVMPQTLPEYGWPLTLEFGRFLRDQMKFATLETLRSQIRRDSSRAVALARH